MSQNWLALLLCESPIAPSSISFSEMPHHLTLHCSNYADIVTKQDKDVGLKEENHST
jgi:hypothetical protein